MSKSEHEINTEYVDTTLLGLTATYYTERTDIRFELSLANTERWRDKGQPLVVVDGTPSLENEWSWVAKAHRSRGAVVLRSEVNGIATQRMQGMKYALAHGARQIVVHEPEKITMADFIPNVAEELHNKDIIVIGRTNLAEMSMPPLQRRTERIAGWILEQTHLLPPDALCGPRAFSAAAGKQLLDYPAHISGMNNWIYMYHTPLEARKSGFQVGGLLLDLIYPEAMVKEETNNPLFDNKRYQQFKLQLDYMLSRNDVEPRAQHIANLVKSRLKGITVTDANETYTRTIETIEEELQLTGYEPAT